MRDELRPEVPEVIDTLNRRGIGVTMLNGDHARTAAALAAKAGPRDVRAELRPADKAPAVADLTTSQPTAMIEVRINPAPDLEPPAPGTALGDKGAPVTTDSAPLPF